ncbi:MAG: 4-hydroxy-3-methylbut-2-enyl diphosphate reductase [Paludibacteraceae bacterium]|jgi:4-hydroxy-3-methylbut-2-enyl diphosphate reductase|nr:4-hydroxy-3-methylbut-2-enyl diphosphate reductase [Paludibacteraceae bacterium]
MSLSVKIEIDENSGFCFGVVNAIRKSEETLRNDHKLYCLGDIVHNTQEVERLKKLGLETINHQQIEQLRDTKVLLRAHGEPPSTYQVAQENNIEIIDASCPVVLQLQKKIKRAFEENPTQQIVIYGKNGHAEVNGLVGQTCGKAIVVESENDIEKIDFGKEIVLFSQTTKSVEGFHRLVDIIKNRLQPDVKFEYNDTICRQVANRANNIREFAQKYDLVLFVSDAKSSNGKILFEECKKVNINTQFISSAKEIDDCWLKNVFSIGICGATSTPKWLMENVANEVRKKMN